jgi:hypothetical protein
MALQPYREVFQDPRFKALSVEGQTQATKDYWDQFSKENPDASDFAKSQAEKALSLIDVRSKKSDASSIASRQLDYYDDALSTRLALSDAARGGAFKSQAEMDAVVSREDARLKERKQQLDKTFSLFDPKVDSEMQPTWAALQKRALESGYFGEQSIRADAMSGPMGNALAGTESQGAVKARQEYEKVRDTVASDFNLNTEEVDDLVKHRMGLQKDMVSRDAAGGIHIKPELLSQGHTAVVSHVDKLPVSSEIKSQIKEIAPIQVSAYKQNFIDDVKQNHPQLAHRIRHHWNGDIDHDFNLILTQLNPEMGAQAGEGMTGGLLRGVGGAVYAASLALDKPFVAAGIENVPQQAAEETINAGKAMQSQQQLSKQIYGKSLQIAGLDVGDIASVGYSLIESVGVGMATGGASALISADRIMRAGKVGKVFLGAAKRMAGVAPLGGLYGLQQAIDVKERGGSDTDALIAGASEMGLTMAFSGVKLGGSDDLGVLLANPEMRNKAAKSVLRAWGEVGLNTAKGTLGETLEESSINLAQNLYVESKLNPGMTRTDLLNSLIETAKLSALPGGVAGVAGSLAEQGSNLFKPTYDQSLESVHNEADARYKAASQESLPEAEAGGGTQQARGAEGVAPPRQQITRDDLEASVEAERSRLERLGDPTIRLPDGTEVRNPYQRILTTEEKRRFELLQGTTDEIADIFGLEIVESTDEEAAVEE